MSASGNRLGIDFLIAEHLHVSLLQRHSFRVSFNNDDKSSGLSFPRELSNRKTHYGARSKVIEVARLTSRARIN